MFQTMLVGHVVDVELVKENEDGSKEVEFLCHHESKSENLCLDLGQNWYVKKGYQFLTYPQNIERAKYWKEKQQSLSVLDLPSKY